MALSGSFLMMRCAVGSYRNILCNRHVLPVYQQNATLKQSIEEKLGLPLKPKKPLTPYFRFMALIRPKLIQALPEAKVTEIVQVTAKKWAEVDPELRQKLETQYKTEMNEYAKTRLKYEQTITNEQRAVIKQERVDRAETKEKLALKRKMKELGKPRKPMTGFLAYMQEKQSLRKTTPFKEWQLQLAKDWEHLEETEKARYNLKSKHEMESYKKELQEWEEKMIRLGHIDVVRNEALIQPKHQARPPRKPKEE